MRHHSPPRPGPDSDLPVHNRNCARNRRPRLRAAGRQNRITLPGNTPRPVTSPSSEKSKSACMPKHTPRNGRSSDIHPRTVSSSLVARSAATQSPSAPTPGSTNPSTAPISAGVRTTFGCAPTASRALVTLRRLQIPLSITAMRGAAEFTIQNMFNVQGSKFKVTGSVSANSEP